MKRVNRSLWVGKLMVLLVAMVTISLAAENKGQGRGSDCHVTDADAQISGENGWKVFPVFTVGETIDGYTPPGILDGIGALKWNQRTTRVLVNHELVSSAGYPYELANGAVLTGARVSYFDIDRKTLGVCDSGLAYDTIYNRAGKVVEGPQDLEFGGLNRLCSSALFEKGEYGFKDDVYFTGEETGGGTEFVLDVKEGELWAVPAMGRAAWENVTAMDSGDRDTVAILIGDDREAAPLLLYVGEKAKSKRNKPGPDFLARNGLAKGRLYVWVADNGDVTPEEFNGTGQCRGGNFVEIDYYRPDLAGNGDYDELGYATQEHQDWLADQAGAFKFSRPEDVATNPYDGTEAALASTGRGGRFPSDNWGIMYTVNIDFDDLSAEVCIIYDGDDAGGFLFDHPDFGIRSPDNIDWADDGYIYINEDRSTVVDEKECLEDFANGLIDEDELAKCLDLAFGATSKIEASMWKLDPAYPVSWDVQRIATIDRSAVLPGGQTDGDPDDIGDWESSGVLDVSNLFDVDAGTLLIADVQAHSVRDGSIGGNDDLVQGGQLFFIYNGDDN